MTSTSSRTLPRQHGVAALAVVAVLFLATMLVAAAASQALLVESRIAANQLRSAQAHQAAEAGLAWVLARLNDTSRLDAVCLPTPTAGASSFRARYLQIDEATGVIAPTTWNDAGVRRPLQSVCVRRGAGWTCSCPSTGWPTWPAAISTESAPAFQVELSATVRPGTLRATATGCSVASRCAPGDGNHEASARVEVELALMGGLRTAPAGALTVRGDVDPGGAGLGLHNVDPDTGVSLHAGGALALGPLRLTAPAGSPADGTVVLDTTLAGSSEEQLFSRYFGMDPAAWSAQPAVTRIVCSGPCGDAVARAIDDGASLVAVEGDLDLNGPLTLGTVGQPVAVVASGVARLRGDVTLNGLLFARGIDWRGAGAPPGALIRGAAVSSAGYAGDVAADFARDRMILERLKRTRGSFALINGSWKDF